MPSAIVSQLVDRSRPVLPEEPRQRPIGEDPPPGLATGAVVRFVVGIADSLNRRAAVRARLIEPPVHGHFLMKCRDVLGEAVSGLGPQPRDPLLQHRSAGLMQAINFLRLELARQCERGKAGTM